MDLHNSKSILYIEMLTECSQKNTSICDRKNVFCVLHARVNPGGSESAFSRILHTILHVKSVQFSKQTQRFYREECAEFRNVFGFPIGCIMTQLQLKTYISAQSSVSLQRRLVSFSTSTLKCNNFVISARIYIIQKTYCRQGCGLNAHTIKYIDLRLQQCENCVFRGQTVRE